jgi:hypothetical protein
MMETEAVVSARYGVMELGRVRARAIAKTPNSVSATSPTFQRVRWVTWAPTAPHFEHTSRGPNDGYRHVTR